MAKGDDKRARNAIDYQGGLAQNNLNNVRGRIEAQYPMHYGQYSNAVDRQLAHYDTLRDDFANMAKTGGFSPQDLANMRSRGMAPNRAIYENARRNIERFGGPSRT